MEIYLFSKKGCKKCESAEEHLRRMQLDYLKIDMEDATIAENNVRLEARAVYEMGDRTLPIFVIDDRGMTMPEAMKYLKGVVRENNVM